MNIQHLHSWNVSYKEAAAIQKKLAEKIVSSSVIDRVSYVAGADISYDKGSNTLFAAVIIFNFPDLKKVEIQSAIGQTSFPYIPGLLSFREIPLLIECFLKVEQNPDLLLCDAHGIAHPRRFGLASHLGLLLNTPSIGCAKTRLIGAGKEPAIEKGSWTSLMFNGVEVGRMVRTRTGVKPMYISIGHLIDIDSAVRFTLACCTKYKMPEPTRQAHIEVNTLRLRFLSGK